MNFGRTSHRRCENHLLKRASKLFVTVQKKYFERVLVRNLLTSGSSGKTTAFIAQILFGHVAPPLGLSFHLLSIISFISSFYQLPYLTFAQKFVDACPSDSPFQSHDALGPILP